MSKRTHKHGDTAPHPGPGCNAKDAENAEYPPQWSVGAGVVCAKGDKEKTCMIFLIPLRLCVLCVLCAFAFFAFFALQPGPVCGTKCA